MEGDNFLGDGVDVYGNANVLSDDEFDYNAGFGIALKAGASNNTIGGQTVIDSGYNDVISNNRLGGVEITGIGTSGNVIQGTLIGLNSGDGVQIDQGAANNVIGGTAPGAGNVIASNFQSKTAPTTNIVPQQVPAGPTGGSWGVQLTPSAGVGNTIEGNSIYGNSTGGIDLGGLPATGNLNPPLSPEPNNAQNAPIITSAAYSANDNTTTIAFTLSSALGGTYRIELFGADPTSKAPQGETFLGYAPVTTDSKGEVHGTFIFQGALPQSETSVTATATDSKGDTSEFSVSRGVTVISIVPLPPTSTPHSSPGGGNGPHHP